MKYFLFILIVLFSNVSLSSPEVKVAAENFVKSYFNQDYNTAVDQIYCPSALSENEIEESKEELIEEIKKLNVGFGKPVEITHFKNNTFTAIILACSDPKNYENLNTVGYNSFIVTHDNGTKSFLKLSYIIASGKTVVGLVSIGDFGISLDKIKQRKKQFNELLK